VIYDHALRTGRAADWADPEWRMLNAGGEVGYSDHVDRLRELLAEKPERARGYDGETLLMYLPPDDETMAIRVATLLLEHGAVSAHRSLRV
jgi:hypothetical protein